MPAEVAERAIQPFFTTKAVGEGSGLGLSMVYGFVMQSGGHMEISSTPGQGTTVRLYLPRSEKPASDDESPARQSAESAALGERILVVEDKPDVRRMARRILTRLGYDVIEAEDADSALAVLSGQSVLHGQPDVDLLFTDVVLPGNMSGIELAEEARARYPALKVLYTSGYAEDAASQGDPPPAGIKFVKKPFVKRNLAGMVRHALGGDAG
jgi:CheY-like chemotaxis protein